MRILLTNDDGISAPGLEVAEAIAARDRRAGRRGLGGRARPSSSRASRTRVSYVRPMRLERLGERRFAVEGSPADCVLAGVCEIVKDGPPDLVLSGVNRGHNVAEDTLYSGTVGGALEGALHGVRARSRCRSTTAPPAAPATIPSRRPAPTAPRVLRAAARRRRRGRPTPYAVFYNVNFPPVPATAVRAPAPPSRATAPAPTFGVLPHVAPNGRSFLWLTHGHGNAGSRAGLGFARVPRRLDHRDAARRRPDRARPHRAACAGARLRRGSVMLPAEQQMQFVYTLRSRGVTNADGAEGDGADAARRSSSKASSRSAPTRTRRCRSPAARPSASRRSSG